MSDFHSLIRSMKCCGELQGRAEMFEGAGAQAPPHAPAELHLR